LLAHRKRARQRDLGDAIGMAAKKLHVSHFNRRRAADFIHHARHRRGLARTRHDDRRVGRVDALKRGCEPVRVALAAHFAIGDDIDSGALHIANGDNRRVVLRLFEIGFGNTPDVP
jgi:hypothetical protein